MYVHMYVGRESESPPISPIPFLLSPFALFATYYIFVSTFCSVISFGLRCMWARVVVYDPGYIKIFIPDMVTKF